MTPLTLDQTAERIGNYVWLESRLFEILGGWVQMTPELHVKEFMAEQSHHHAWHMELWRDRLPHLRERDVEALIRPSNTTVEDVLVQVGGSEDEETTINTTTETTIERLARVYRVVVPWIIGTYSRHREQCSPAADRPVLRVLDLVLRDELEDWRRGETIIQTLIATGSSGEIQERTEKIHSEIGKIEKLLVRAGGLVVE